MDNKELFDMLTSTMWQDYKGYKRSLNIKSSAIYFIKGLIVFIIGVGLTIGCLTSKNDVGILLIFTIPMVIYGLANLIPWFIRNNRLSHVDSVAYDIELTTNNVKMVRTKKSKYGVINECDDPFGSGTYPCIILYPKYDSMERVDDSTFILAQKNRKSGKLYYGIYNSELKQISVPIEYDSIKRPSDSANLFIAKRNDVVEKFNSQGDRIIR